MDLLQKLEIQADAAKYDASCASSGTLAAGHRPGTALDSARLAQRLANASSLGPIQGELFAAA